MKKNDRNSRKTAVLQPKEGLSGKHLRLIILLCAIIVIALIAHCILRPDRNASLKIIYTGNMEGQVESTEEYAGYARIASLAKKLASDGSHVLLLDAGNSLGGSINAEVDEGQSMISIMNTVGYDALVPGTVDFSYGIDTLLSLRSKASFPFLAANIFKSDGSSLFENYKILTINSVRIGIIGVTTGLNASRAEANSLVVADPVETVKTLIQQMSDRTDAVIVVAYTGDDEVTSALGNIDGVSIVIESNSPEAYANTTDKGTVIASAGERGNAIGVTELDITRSNTSVDNTFYESSDFNQLSEDNTTQKAISEVQQALTANEAMQLGNITINEVSSSDSTDTSDETDDSESSDSSSDSSDTSAVFTGHNTETGTGNFIADAMLSAASDDQAAIAVIPDKDIAGLLVTGPVTRGQVDALFDSHLYLVTCKMTGGELRTALEASFDNYPQAENFLQISGITYTFNSTTSIGSRLSDIMVNGHALDDARTYVVAMPDTLASQLGYTSESTGKISSGKTIASITADYIQKNTKTDVTAETQDNVQDTEETSSDDNSRRITIIK